MSKINIIVKNSKDKTSFPFIVEQDITVEQLKIKLEKEIGDYATEIKILYSSQILDDKKTLSSYGIQDNTTIFFFYKKKKNTKTKLKKGESSGSINKDNNNNGGNGGSSNSTIINIGKAISSSTTDKSDQKPISVYSSIMKILTYKDPNDMRKIIDFLRKKHPEIINEISDNKISFLNFFGLPIKKDDIETYKENYEKVREIIDAIDGEENDKKFKIFLTEDEDKYINLWKRRGVDREKTILEFVNNKFNTDKTDNILVKYAKK